MITRAELEFLRESNNIEDVWDDTSLEDAIMAWQDIKVLPKLEIKDILATHFKLMRRQPLDEAYKGVFRKIPVWVGMREGAEWQHLDKKMHAWLILLNNRTVTEQTNKADHVDYEKIHPFVDGNGRTGRIFMNWQRLKAHLPILVIYEKSKKEYYEWFTE